MCGECQALSNAAQRHACISKTLDMPLKVTDKTDKTPSRRHRLCGEYASDVLTKPTEGLCWFIPSLGGSRDPREQPRMPTWFAALFGPVLGLPVQAGRPRGAPRWAVGQRTPPGRTDLRLGRPVGPGRPSCAFGGQEARRGGPLAARDAAWMHKETDLPVRCAQVGNMEVRREYRT